MVTPFAWGSDFPCFPGVLCVVRRLARLARLARFWRDSGAIRFQLVPGLPSLAHKNEHALMRQFADSKKRCIVLFLWNGGTTEDRLGGTPRPTGRSRGGRRWNAEGTTASQFRSRRAFMATSRSKGQAEMESPRHRRCHVRPAAEA